MEDAGIVKPKESKHETPFRSLKQSPLNNSEFDNYCIQNSASQKIQANLVPRIYLGRREMKKSPGNEVASIEYQPQTNLMPSWFKTWV